MKKEKDNKILMLVIGGLALLVLSGLLVWQLQSSDVSSDGDEDLTGAGGTGQSPGLSGGAWPGGGSRVVGRPGRSGSAAAGASRTQAASGGVARPSSPGAGSGASPIYPSRAPGSAAGSGAAQVHGSSPVTGTPPATGGRPPAGAEDNVSGSGGNQPAVTPKPLHAGLPPTLPGQPAPQLTLDPKTNKPIPYPTMRSRVEKLDRDLKEAKQSGSWPQEKIAEAENELDELKQAVKIKEQGSSNAPPPGPGGQSQDQPKGEPKDKPKPEETDKKETTKSAP